MISVTMPMKYTIQQDVTSKRGWLDLLQLGFGWGAVRVCREGGFEMALAGALAARSMRREPRGRNDSSSPLAAAVTLFEEGWQGGDIPGVFNDEEELERDLAKLKQIADDVWRCVAGPSAHPPLLQPPRSCLTAADNQPGNR